MKIAAFFGSFFKTLEQSKKGQLISKIESQNKNLIALSNEYPMIFVAPILEIVGTKIYKSIAIINK